MKMSVEVQGQVEKQLVRWKIWSGTFYPLTRQWSSKDILLEAWSLIGKRAKKFAATQGKRKKKSQLCWLLWGKNQNWYASFGMICTTCKLFLVNFPRVNRLLLITGTISKASFKIHYLTKFDIKRNINKIQYQK